MRLQSVVSIAIFFLAWELISSLNLLPRALVPAPSDVVAVLLNPSNARIMAINFSLTAMRATVGLVLGIISGVSLGLLFSFRSMHNFIQPIATLLFAIPSVAWVPMMIVWVGIKEFELPVAISFLCSFPPVLYGMINALRTFDSEQIDVAMVLGAKPQTILLKIVIPQSLLKIVPLIKAEAVMVWKSVFVTEMVALSSGLGYLAMIYATTLEMDSLIAVVLILALTTLTIIQVFDLAERKLSTKWLGDSKCRSGLTM